MRDQFKADRRLHTVRVRTYITVEPPDYDPDNPDLFPADRTVLNSQYIVSDEVIKYSYGFMVEQVIETLLRQHAERARDHEALRRVLKKEAGRE